MTSAATWSLEPSKATTRGPVLMVPTSLSRSHTTMRPVRPILRFHSSWNVVSTFAEKFVARMRFSAWNSSSGMTSVSAYRRSFEFTYTASVRTCRSSRTLLKSASSASVQEVVLSEAPLVATAAISAGRSVPGTNVAKPLANTWNTEPACVNLPVAAIESRNSSAAWACSMARSALGLMPSLAARTISRVA